MGIDSIRFAVVQAADAAAACLPCEEAARAAPAPAAVPHVVDAPDAAASLQAQLPLLSMEAATAAWRATLGAYAGDVVECASCGIVSLGTCFVSLDWCRGDHSEDDEVVF